MAQIWLRGANGRYLIDANSVGCVGTVVNADNTCSWALYPTSTPIGNPSYTTSQTFPDPPTALAAGLLALVLELP